MSLPAERTMPILDAMPEGDGWRLAMPDGTTAWLPTREACTAVARRLYAAVRPLPANLAPETDTELKEAWGR